MNGKNVKKRKEISAVLKKKLKRLKKKSPDQSAINLSIRDLTPSKKSVLAKGSTLVPNKC